MKVQGPTSPQSQSSKNLKKVNSNGTFQTFLETEIAGTQNKTPSEKQEQKQADPQQRWQLVEEAAALLDHALEQLAAGEKPADDILNSIQQLRTQLYQHSDQKDDALNQADAILAVEAERIHFLNH